jgi:energy-coupling factor transporter ATP-binding protein EcfA2
VKKKNPFKYGELSTGENFCNRKAELKRLHSAFRDGQSIVLISPRRWGKSSLVDHALGTYKGKLYQVKIDCFGISSSEEFYATVLKSVLLATTSKLKQLTDTVTKHIKSFIPYIKYTVGEGEELSISLDFPESKLDPGTVLDLAQKIAHQRKIRVVVCIDEFQKIAEWQDGAVVLEKLRSHWQKHKEVTYCLYGSKRHVMSGLFSHSLQPFYRFGETILLNKIEHGEWVSFLLSEFRKTGKSIAIEVAQELVSLVESHSYYVQYLARICWNNGKDKITPAILKDSWAELLNDHLALFQNIVKGLTLYQTNYIKALLAGETQLTSQRVLQAYQLGSQGNIKRIANALEDQEILDYSTETPSFCDPYFAPLFKKYFVSK